ncbi:hypothetical protein C8R42DRAFT_720382 [Lentinula raphanica]|nr:hypothetical protein C8R42DRAFT_720382 [Lentinula raphanica]
MLNDNANAHNIPASHDHAVFCIPLSDRLPFINKYQISRQDAFKRYTELGDCKNLYLVSTKTYWTTFRDQYQGFTINIVRDSTSSAFGQQDFASSISVNSALQELATENFAMAMATLSLHMMPIHPQVADTAVFTTPTFASSAKVSLTWASNTFSAATYSCCHICSWTALDLIPADTSSIFFVISFVSSCIAFIVSLMSMLYVLRVAVIPATAACRTSFSLSLHDASCKIFPIRATFSELAPVHCLRPRSPSPAGQNV